MLFQQHCLLGRNVLWKTQRYWKWFNMNFTLISNPGWTIPTGVKASPKPMNCRPEHPLFSPADWTYGTLWPLSAVNPLLSCKAIFICTWHYCYLWWWSEHGERAFPNLWSPHERCWPRRRWRPIPVQLLGGGCIPHLFSTQGGAQSEAAHLLSSVLIQDTLTHLFPGSSPLEKR